MVSASTVSAVINEHSVRRLSYLHGASSGIAAMCSSKCSYAMFDTADMLSADALCANGNCVHCRAETAALLQQHAAGTFLLRLNGKNTDSIVISFVTAAAAATSTATAALQHVLVKVESEGRCSMTLSQHLQHSSSSSGSISSSSSGSISSSSSAAAAYRKQDYPTLAELISECAALTALLPAAAADSSIRADQLQAPEPIAVAIAIAKLRSVR
jgi:hypothetical protein